MLFLTTNQQHQSTEGDFYSLENRNNFTYYIESLQVVV